MLLHNRKLNKKQIVKRYDDEQLPKIYDFFPPLIPLAFCCKVILKD